MNEMQQAELPIDSVLEWQVGKFKANVHSFSIEALDQFVEEYPYHVAGELEDESAAVNHLRKWFIAGAGGKELMEISWRRLQRENRSDPRAEIEKVTTALIQLGDAIGGCRSMKIYLAAFPELEFELKNLAAWLDFVHFEMDKNRSDKDRTSLGKPTSEEFALAYVAWKRFFPATYPIAKAARVIASAIGQEIVRKKGRPPCSAESIRVTLTRLSKLEENENLAQSLAKWGVTK